MAREIEINQSQLRRRGCGIRGAIENHDADAGQRDVSRNHEREILIDTHIGPPITPVLELWLSALERFPRAPTLFEWDNELPPLDTLVAEAARLDRIRETRDVHAR